MADAPIVHIGENSPEEVAFKLLVAVAGAEKKYLAGTKSSGSEHPTREWILGTYAECLAAVRGHDPLKDK